MLLLLVFTFYVRYFTLLWTDHLLSQLVSILSARQLGSGQATRMADYNYKCDKCDEGFNLNIKLKKHILADHGQTDDDLPLTKEEKIKLFDDLKEKYLEASSKCSRLETKFQSLQSKLKSLSLKNNFKQKNYRGLDDTVGSYEHIETDDTIPRGWKSSWKKLDFCNKKSKIYWAPNGKFCSSRREAILYMVEQLRSPAEDVLQMKAGLIQDGWKEDQVLAGWYFRRVNTGKDKSSNVFISSDLNHFKSPKAVLSHLLKFSSEKEISEVSEICSVFLIISKYFLNLHFISVRNLSPENRRLQSAVALQCGYSLSLESCLHEQNQVPALLQPRWLSLQQPPLYRGVHDERQRGDGGPEKVLH